MKEVEIERIEKRWKGCLAHEDVQSLISALKKLKEEIEEMEEGIERIVFPVFPDITQEWISITVSKRNWESLRKLIEKKE